MPDLDRLLDDGPMRPLTPRQRDVAERIGRGKSYAEIGAELGLAEGTVKNYVAAIALLFRNPDDLEPYLVVFLYIRHRAARYQPSGAEERMTDEPETLRALDALIAEKVLGWELRPNHGMAGGRLWCRPGRGHNAILEANLPRFSVDVGQAWHVVNAMHARPEGYLLDLCATGGRSGYAATFETIDDYEEWWDRPAEHGGVHCETAAEAICRAALSSLGVLRGNAEAH